MLFKTFLILHLLMVSAIALPAPDAGIKVRTTIDPEVDDVTSLALDRSETWLYFSQCCGSCKISRINVKNPGEPQVVYLDEDISCYDLAIVGDQLFFSVVEENTTYRQQQDLNGEWLAVPWDSPEVDRSRRWRWAHSPTASIMQIRLEDSTIQDPIVFEHDVYPTTFMVASTVEPNILYIGFEGPTYAAEGSKVVRYYLDSSERETILENIKVSYALGVEDFIIYATPSRISPGNTGKLYRKRLGSDEHGTLLASGLASPKAICQTYDTMVLNGLGDDDSSSLQQAVVGFSTDSLLNTKGEIQPTVLKDGLQSYAMTCTLSGSVYYAGYRYHEGLYKLTV